MITNKEGFFSLPLSFFLPLFFSVFIFVVSFFYYFSFRLASQYYSYQALLCGVSKQESLCLKDFRKNLQFFKGIQIVAARIKKVETSKSFKLKISWQDQVLKKPKIGRENSVYIPKRL